MRWFQKAAGQGSAKAQYQLGYHYGVGRAVPEEIVQAYMWFDLAAKQGHRIAQLSRELSANRMTTEQIAEAHHLAQEWLAKQQK